LPRRCHTDLSEGIAPGRLKDTLPELGRVRYE
jgi:hypothetical protein